MLYKIISFDRIVIDVRALLDTNRLVITNVRTFETVMAAMIKDIPEGHAMCLDISGIEIMDSTGLASVMTQVFRRGIVLRILEDDTSDQKKLLYKMIVEALGLHRIIAIENERGERY